jgi:hypothetical protein
MMVRRPVVSSIRSRQTGQVGNSIREGVGGARGLAERGAGESPGDGLTPAPRVLVGFATREDVEKASLETSDNLEVVEFATWISTDFTKTTWQVSG